MGPIIHYLNNLLPSQLHDMKITQIIIMDPCNTYNIPWYVHRNLNISDSADFNFFVSLFCFKSRIPHPAIVFH